MFDSHGTMPDMAAHFSHVSSLILEQLAVGERRVLSLIVSVTKAMNRDGGGKGNSSALVRSAYWRWLKRERSSRWTGCIHWRK